MIARAAFFVNHPPIEIENSLSRHAGSVLSGNQHWDDDKYSIYGEALVQTSLNDFGDIYSVRGQVGLRVKW